MILLVKNLFVVNALKSHSCKLYRTCRIELCPGKETALCGIIIMCTFVKALLTFAGNDDNTSARRILILIVV